MRASIYIISAVGVLLLAIMVMNYKTQVWDVETRHKNPKITVSVHLFPVQKSTRARDQLMFKDHDTDGNGFISDRELEDMLSKKYRAEVSTNPKAWEKATYLPQAENRKIAEDKFDAINTDKNETIDENEYVQHYAEQIKNLYRGLATTEGIPVNRNIKIKLPLKAGEGN